MRYLLRETLEEIDLKMNAPDSPSCPKCGNYNAMLCEGYQLLRCRDCGCEIIERDEPDTDSEAREFVNYSVSEVSEMMPDDERVAGFARLSLLLTLAVVMLFGAVIARSQTQVRKVDKAIASVSAPQKEVKEAHYCGAMTKKGTACKNRVKKAGELCWLHRAAGTR